jgi:hypothetical protein
MKAAIYHDVKNVTIEEIADPVCGIAVLIERSLPGTELRKDLLR